MCSTFVYIHAGTTGNPNLDKLIFQGPYGNFSTGANALPMNQPYSTSSLQFTPGPNNAPGITATKAISGSGFEWTAGAFGGNDPGVSFGFNFKC